jgi:hypothetical protein
LTFGGTSDSTGIVCPFVSFLLAIVLSHLLQFTVSDYLFGIFNLFLEQVPDKFATWGNRKCSFIQADITYSLSLEIQTQYNSTTLSKGIERSQQFFRTSHLEKDLK